MIRIENLTYRVGGRTLFDGADAMIGTGWHVGLVGRNGAGKSTLLRLLLGKLQPDGGDIGLPKASRLGMVAQEAPGGEQTPLDFVVAADRERATLLAEREEPRDPHRVAEIEARLAEIAAHSAPARAATILAGLGFDATAQARPLASFAGGWRMRAALAAVLFSEPDVLLLDEPTNHLDFEATIWLESHLKSYARTMIVVSHDRRLLNEVVDRIVHLESGRLALYPGGYDSFERIRRERLALNASMRAKQEAQRRHIQSFVDRFRAKASKATQAQSRMKALARMEPIAEAAAVGGSIDFAFPEPEPAAPPLIAMEGVVGGYAADLPVLRRLDLRLDADDRIALIGANGNGKSTFAKLVAGRLAPLSGRLFRSPKLTVGFFAQHQIEDLRPQWSSFAHLEAVMPGARQDSIRAWLGRFGLSQEKAEIPAASLSGGEKSRLAFALLARASPNLLILDEPTNHLDIDSREALAQALNDFSGAVLLITHDWHLIEATCDRLWLVADGAVSPFDGDLDDYRRLLLDKARRPADNPSQRGTPSGRKENRREAAENRARVSPLRKATRDAEAVIASLAQERKAIEAALADPRIYNGGQAETTARLKRRAALDREIAAAERLWLEAAEALEAAQASTEG